MNDNNQDGTQKKQGEINLGLDSVLSGLERELADKKIIEQVSLAETLANLANVISGLNTLKNSSGLEISIKDQVDGIIDLGELITKNQLKIDQLPMFLNAITTTYGIRQKVEELVNKMINKN